MRLIVYAVIVTYSDFYSDLDNIFPTKESAIAHAQKVFKHPDVSEVEVDKDEITEEFGRVWLDTVYAKKREEMD